MSTAQGENTPHAVSGNRGPHALMGAAGRNLEQGAQAYDAALGSNVGAPDQRHSPFNSAVPSGVGLRRRLDPAPFETGAFDRSATPPAAGGPVKRGASAAEKGMEPSGGHGIGNGSDLNRSSWPRSSAPPAREWPAFSDSVTAFVDHSTAFSRFPRANQISAIVSR